MQTLNSITRRVDTTSVDPQKPTERWGTTSMDPAAAAVTLLPPSTQGVYYSGTALAAGHQFLIHTGSRTDPSALQPISEYREVSQTLDEMRHSDADGEWNIEQDVYNTSVQIAAALFDKNIPAPDVFSHGPKSVVFNWEDGIHNLYLTIGRTRLWATASTSSGIKGQIELTGPDKYLAGDFLKAIAMQSMNSVSLLCQVISPASIVK